jgi:hypothetical protein
MRHRNAPVRSPANRPLGAVVPASRPVRVLVLGNVRLVREGIALLIGADERLRLVGTTAIDADVQRLVRGERPDVALVDAATLRESEITQSLLAIDAALRVVAYGIVDEELEAVKCAEAGAAGYVSREATRDDLVTTILGEVTLTYSGIDVSPRAVYTPGASTTVVGENPTGGVAFGLATPARFKNRSERGIMRTRPI